MNFTDDTPVNAKELAATLRVSRSTVFNWKKQGYRFEFGIRTTPGTEALDVFSVDYIHGKAEAFKGFASNFSKLLKLVGHPIFFPRSWTQD